MTVQQLCQALALKEQVPVPEPDREVTGCYIGDLLSWVMGRAPADSVWITVMQNANVAAVALLADVACVVLAEGVTPDEALRARALEKGIALFTADADAYTLATQLHALLRV